MAWIQTYDGGLFNISDPCISDVNAITIGMSLSRMCRWGGHCKQFYSVAQHSVIVSQLVSDSRLRLPALLHDAHECYWGFGDICSPAKQCLSAGAQRELSGLKRQVDKVIAEFFGFDQDLFYHPKVKAADLKALATEQRDLLLPCVVDWAVGTAPAEDYAITPLAAQEAFELFDDALLALAA